MYAFMRGLMRFIVHVYLVGLFKVSGAENVPLEGPLIICPNHIGTVVFPDAEHKFYLVASLDEKVRRRKAQYERRGERVDEEAMRKEVAERDRIDSERPVAPLRPAEDAVIIDTDHLDLDQVVDRIVGDVRR